MLPARGDVVAVRRHFAGLPFQISHFNRLGEVPCCLGLASTLPFGRLTASVDQDGRLRVNRAEVAQLQDALRDVGVQSLAQVFERHMARRRSLALAVGESRVGQAKDETQLLACIDRIGESIAALAPYGLATKFLPGVLSRLAREQLESGSISLSRDEREACLEPAMTRATRIAGDWLSLAEFLRTDSSSRLVRDRINGFCNRHVGFGPSAWEAPGLENRVEVAQRLRDRFGGQDPHALEEMSKRWQSIHGRRHLRRKAAAKLERLDRRGDVSRLAANLRYWHGYVDWQTGVLRRAFFLGLLPALKALSTLWLRDSVIEARDDIFFLTRQEIRLGPGFVDPSAIRLRRVRYDSNRAEQAYPVMRAGRLMSLFDDPCSIRSAPPSTEPGSGQPGRRLIDVPDKYPEDLGYGIPAAAPHTVRAPAYVLGVGREFPSAASRHILVAERITADLAPLFLSVMGIVVEEGGLIQHASILARDFDLPCVIGLAGVSRRIHPGTVVELDGRSGRVRLLGEREEMA